MSVKTRVLSPDRSDVRRLYELRHFYLRRNYIDLLSLFQIPQPCFNQGALGSEAESGSRENDLGKEENYALYIKKSRPY
jgi:hypothetical protein